MSRDELEELIRFVDTTPAVTWGGRDGAKQRILEKYSELFNENGD